MSTRSQLNEAASLIDPMLAPCSSCGGQLRLEFKVEWRPMSEACAVCRMTPADVIASGAKIDGFGRVKAGVPYVTCMHCGLHADATDAPESHDVPTGADNG